MPTRRQRPVHGNSHLSNRANHVYEIVDTRTGQVHKYGISGGRIRQDGASSRAEKQVRELNNAVGSNVYRSRIIRKNLTRQKAVAVEQGRVNAFSVARQQIGLAPSPVEPPGNVLPKADF